MSKKYIIELEDEPFYKQPNNKQTALWRVKGFNSLVFDQNGLEKLAEAKDNPDRTYYTLEDFKAQYREAKQDGINKAINLIKRLNKIAPDWNLFNGKAADDILEHYTYEEIARAVDRYTQLNEVQIGDEVVWYGSPDGDKYCVITNVEEDHWLGLLRDRESCSIYNYYNWHKTGRHFPEVVELFKKIDMVDLVKKLDKEEDKK